MNDKLKGLLSPATCRFIILVIATMTLLSWIQVQMIAHGFATNNKIFMESGQLHTQNHPSFSFPYSLNDVRGLLKVNSDLKIALVNHSYDSTENTQLMDSLVDALNASNKDQLQIMERAVSPYFILYQSSWWIGAILMLSVFGQYIRRRTKNVKLVSFADNKPGLFLLVLVFNQSLSMTTYV